MTNMIKDVIGRYGVTHFYMHFIVVYYTFLKILLIILQGIRISLFGHCKSNCIFLPFQHFSDYCFYMSDFTRIKCLNCKRVGTGTHTENTRMSSLIPVQEVMLVIWRHRLTFDIRRQTHLCNSKWLHLNKNSFKIWLFKHHVIFELWQGS